MAIFVSHSGLHCGVSHCSCSFEGRDTITHHAVSILHSTTFTFNIHNFYSSIYLSQLTQKDLLALDFEGILNYFRVSLPRKISSEDECKLLFDTAYSFKVCKAM